MATQEQSTRKPSIPSMPSIQPLPRQERYQIITADNGDQYVLDRLENKVYRIVQPIHKTIPS